MRSAFVALAIASWIAAGEGAQAQEVSVSGGLNVRLITGTFGSDQTTTLVYVPASFRVDVHRFELTGTVPFLSVSNGTVAWTQGGFIPMQGSMTTAPGAGFPMGGSMGGGMMGSSGTVSPPTTATGSPSATATLINESGIGDILLSAGYRIIDNLGAGLQVVLATRVKVPSASAAHALGTGKTDVGGIATVRKTFLRGWLYGEGGVVKLGDPQGLDLRNAVLWSIGGGRQIASHVFLIGSAYGNTSTTVGVAAPAEVGAGIGVTLRRSTSLTIVPIVGLSSSSPKYGLTIGITSDLRRR
jgi:hypothetical protein